MEIRARITQVHRAMPSEMGGVVRCNRTLQERALVSALERPAGAKYPVEDCFGEHCDAAGQVIIHARGAGQHRSENNFHARRSMICVSPVRHRWVLASS